MNRNGVEDRGTREEAAQLCARGAGSYSGAGVSLSGCADAVWGEGIVSPEELVFHPQGKGHIFPWLGHWATQCHMLLLATYAPLNYDRGSGLELAWLHDNNSQIISADRILFLFSVSCTTSSLTSSPGCLSGIPN